MQDFLHHNNFIKHLKSTIFISNNGLKNFLFSLYFKFYFKLSAVTASKRLQKFLKSFRVKLNKGTF